MLAKPAPEVQDRPTVTEAEGLANVKAAFPVLWAREFVHHPKTGGGTLIVDPRTGTMYDETPRMHSQDGSDL